MYIVSWIFWQGEKDIETATTAFKKTGYPMVSSLLHVLQFELVMSKSIAIIIDKKFPNIMMFWISYENVREYMTGWMCLCNQL